MFDSVTSVALSSALDGLALRQRVIANNIANVNTPNYHAKRVTFEDALAQSVGAGSGRVAAATQLSLEPTQLNGNNVNLDTEHSPTSTPCCASSSRPRPPARSSPPSVPR